MHILLLTRNCTNERYQCINENQCVLNKLTYMVCISTLYSSVLNTSHVATIWNFDPNYSLPNVTQVSLPKMFQIVATWIVFSTEE